MAYNVSVGDSEIRVAYIAIVIYIVFAITALIIVWTCFKEKAGIGRLKEVVIGDNYDAAAFNADVNIDMNANNNHGAPKMLMEMDLAKRLNWKRSKTELEMANLEPERMKSKDIANFNEYDEDMFSNIDLANNPLSNDSNNMIQQLKIGKSVNNVNNSDAIHRSPSYQGNAIRLEELSNYDLDEVKSEINGHSYASTVHTLAINSQMKPRGGHHHNGESQQVLISMQNNHSINIQSSPSVSNKKYVLIYT